MIARFEQELAMLLAERGDLHDGEVVTSWALVASIQSIERSETTGYSIVHAEDSPMHVVAGLFRVAEHVSLNSDG